MDLHVFGCVAAGIRVFRGAKELKDPAYTENAEKKMGGI